MRYNIIMWMPFLSLCLLFLFVCVWMLYGSSLFNVKLSIVTGYDCYRWKNVFETRKKISYTCSCIHSTLAEKTIARNHLWLALAFIIISLCLRLHRNEIDFCWDFEHMFTGKLTLLTNFSTFQQQDNGQITLFLRKKNRNILQSHMVLLYLTWITGMLSYFGSYFCIVVVVIMKHWNLTLNIDKKSHSLCLNKFLHAKWYVLRYITVANLSKCAIFMTISVPNSKFTSRNRQKIFCVYLSANILVCIRKPTDLKEKFTNKI